MINFGLMYQKKELSSRYNHLDVEEKWYQEWEKKQAFAPEYIKKLQRNYSKPPYCIVIPPPNVTGQLHVGHALNMTIQDVLIRLARKLGYNTLWIPGTDHAGIATQSRVEKELKEKENLTRFDLGREKFLERVWQWKEHYGNVITKQMRKLGVSVDWTRERFTMDEGLSKAVRKVFVDLYKQGIIYRDTKMVNWDPETKTVLSDLEVEYEENFKGELWSFAYPLADGGGEIVVATTRPETMLGDTAIAVHPDDVRYKHLIGKKVKHPLLNREIPIIADAILVDPEFGTGAVKVTPAHDPNDFEVGKRHNLEFITIFDESARINENGGPYKGLDRFEARKKIKEDIAKLGLDRGTKENIMSIGRSQRSNAIVEPMISTQWFVKTQPLAEKAIEVVEKEIIQFVPKRWENLYFSWMRNIKDWCISRQLWWGHQIPAWYCKDCNHITVSMEDVEKCEKCHSKNIERDPDVLDTWFSSALWPFSTMGWPEQTEDLKTYYPTTVLVTGFDIIFFWVARMIMMGMKFMKDVPFRDVYIHALVRDSKGQKMSKSKGNVIDPIVMIEKYGADAFRFTLAAFAAQGRDIKFSEERVEGYRHFINKIWNAMKFIMSFAHLRTKEEVKLEDVKSLKDRWILSKLSDAIYETNRALDAYRFNDAAGTVYQFLWHEFCDWYIELSKVVLYSDTEEKDETVNCLFYVFENILKLLHPFMPYVTEEIWLNILGKEKSLMISLYPTHDLINKDEEAIDKMEHIIEAISGIRSIRGELNIAPSLNVDVYIKSLTPQAENILNEGYQFILKLAKAKSLKIQKDLSRAKGSAVSVKKNFEIYIPIKGLIDIEQEKRRLLKELQKTEQDINFLNKKLMNEDFIKNAPEDVVKKDKEKYEGLLVKHDKIKENLSVIEELKN